MNYIANEEILIYLLKIISILSLDDQFVADKLISNNAIKHILDVLYRKNLERDYIILSVRILGNLMCRSDSVVEVILLYTITIYFK